MSISQSILGMQPTLNGLRIDPCVPADWKRFTLHRRYRGAEYTVHVENPKGVQKGVAAVTADGKPITGNVLPVAPAGSSVTVEVTLG